MSQGKSGLRRWTLAGLMFAVVAAIGAASSAQTITPLRTYPVPGDGKPLAAEAQRTKAWLNYSSGVSAASPDQFDVLSSFTEVCRFQDDEYPAFPFNLGLLEAPLPGDFLPVGATLASDSMAFVPAGQGNRTTSWNGLSRATLNGKVDLVTGVPLAQFTDLSLPFGGAEFRLIRTRSAARGLVGRSASDNAVRRSPVESSFWDWAGSGWMLSENPILIIDSRGPDLVGGAQPRCWLWLDAFHSIPFDWVDDGTAQVEADGSVPAYEIQKGHYDCAPRFRAKLRATRSGTKEAGRIVATGNNPDAGDWHANHHPDKFTVTMFEGEVVYEFTPVWQDVPSWQYEWVPPITGHVPSDIQWSSLHGRPMLPIGRTDISPSDSGSLAFRTPWLSTPIGLAGTALGLNGRGLGMSYYGLLSRVRDKQGNKAEFKYSTVCEVATPDGSTQWTTQKGALSEVKLYQAGQTTPVWSLVYGYRLVPRTGDHCVGIGDSSIAPTITDIEGAWYNLSLAQKITWSDPALESVYVFEGNVETRGITLFRPPDESLWQSGATNPHRSPADADDLLARFQSDGSDNLEVWYAAPLTPAGASDIKNRSDWMFRCRYTYASTDRPSGASMNGTGIRTSASGEEIYEGIKHSPALVRSELQHRHAGTGPIRSLRNYVFQYDGEAEYSNLRWLNSIFDDAGLARVHADVRASPDSLEQTIRDLADGYVCDEPEVGNNLGLASNKSSGDFHDAAQAWFGQEFVPYHISNSRLEADMSRAILPGDADEYVYDVGANGDRRGTVKAFSVTDAAAGRRRHYRITRLNHGPASFSTAMASEFGFGELPMRCIFTSPYWWQAYPHATETKWPTFSGTFAWQGTTAGGSATNMDVSYDKHRWVAIIDEFPTWKDASQALRGEIVGLGGTWSSFPLRAMNRRIVGMNPQGNVLWEKTYSLQNGKFSEGGDTGLNESYIYQSGKVLLQAKGVELADISENLATEQYLVERRTVGYAAATNLAAEGEATRKSEGLIYTYDYKDVAPTATAFTLGERFRPVTEGIQKGNSYSDAPEGTGVKQILRQTYYDENDPTIVTGTAQFTGAPSSGAYASLSQAMTDANHIAILSRSETIREPNNSTGPYTKLEYRTISPGRRVLPNGPLYYDVSIGISNARGQNVWSISAFVQDPDLIGKSGWSTDSLTRVVLNYSKYDGYGRLKESYVDVGRNAAFVDSTDQDLLPANLDRCSSEGSAAAAYLTKREYDIEGVSDIFFPSKKRWARRVVYNVPDAAEEEEQINNGLPFTRIFTFNDAFPKDLNNLTGLYTCDSVGLIQDYKKYRPNSVFMQTAGGDVVPNEMIRERRATFGGEFSIDALSSSPPIVRELAQMKFGFDSAGRIQKVELLEPTATGGLAAMAEVSDNADRVTTTDLDGTKTRMIRNGRGQVTRTYQGTSATDFENVWDDDAWPGTVNPDPLATTNRFDMLLKSRVELGATPHDALLPTKQWSYLKQPEWGSEELKPFGPAPADDLDGERTTTKYDWRMRPVRVDVEGPHVGGVSGSRPRLSTRVTYLDHADRPRVEVSYGAGVNPTLDPSTAAIDATIPTVQSILNGSVTPSSVVETLYNTDGTVQERRTYRLPVSGSGGYTPGSSPQYTAERFGYGPGGKTIFSMQPGSPIRVTTLDNLGRVAKEASVLARGSGGSTTYDFELTRTDSYYDSESNVILTERWERLTPPNSSSDVSSGTPSLSNTNAVMQRTETWYDVGKRVLATMEYGSGTGAFSSSGVSAFSPSSHSEIPGDAPTLKITMGSGGTIDGATYATENIPTTSGRLTLFRYKDGQKIASLSSIAGEGGGGVLTTYEYDDRGNLHRQIEDATGLKKETKYEQWLGRTISVSGLRLNEEGLAGNAARRQYQGVAYGAQIVAEDSSAYGGGVSTQSPDLKYISNSNALVGVMMSVGAVVQPAEKRR